MRGRCLAYLLLQHFLFFFEFQRAPDQLERRVGVAKVRLEVERHPEVQISRFQISLSQVNTSNSVMTYRLKGAGLIIQTTPIT